MSTDKDFEDMAINFFPDPNHPEFSAHLDWVTVEFHKPVIEPGKHFRKVMVYADGLSDDPEMCQWPAYYWEDGTFRGGRADLITHWVYLYGPPANSQADLAESNALEHKEND